MLNWCPPEKRGLRSLMSASKRLQSTSLSDAISGWVPVKKKMLCTIKFLPQGMLLIFGNELRLFMQIRLISFSVSFVLLDTRLVLLLLLTFRNSETPLVGVSQDTIRLQALLL